MKKLFFAVCFSFMFCQVASARVRPLSGYESIPQRQEVNAEPKVYDIEVDEFRKIVEEGIKNAPKADESTINKNIGIVPSSSAMKAKKEQEKGMFQKIYEQALERVGAKKQETPLRQDVFQSQAPVVDVESQKENWSNNLPVVNAYLPPDNRPVAVPALEHIPYLMNSIEVLPNGLVKFEETIVVVANGEKLKHGLTKILPSGIYNETGKRQKLDYSVIGVRINDMPVDYKMVESGNNIFMVPEDDYALAPGIYTYKFEYLADNLLMENEDYYGFYWDIGGNGWNLVVDRLGASLALPKENSVLEQTVLLGGAGYLQDNAVQIRPNGRYAVAYIAARPLFIGEGMHLMARISKDAVMPPAMWQKIVRLFYDKGDIYLTLLGLLVITVSFAVSWRYIAKDKGQLKLSLGKTASTIRYLLFDRFDVKSVCGVLLELYRKNIVDIQQSGDTILLIKRTDNVKSLEKSEQKALRRLFPGHETVFNVTKQNLLPFKRFAADLERGVRRRMLMFRLKLNAGYLFFSLGMMVVTEAFVALFKTNSLYAFGVMFVTSCVALGAAALWYSAKRRWVKVLVRLFSLDLLVVCFIVLSAVIHPLAAAVLLAASLVIVFALAVYAKRMGLIKHYIQDMGMFKDYLKEHHDNIVLGRDFLNYQAAIWALDMEKDFVPAGNPEYYKLPIVENIRKCFG